MAKKTIKNFEDFKRIAVEKAFGEKAEFSRKMWEESLKLRYENDEISFRVSDFDNGNITVMEFLKIYLSQKCTIRSTTEQSYRKILVSVEPYTLSRLRVNQVKLVDAKAFVIELSRDGRKYSTIQTYKSFIKS